MSTRKITKSLLSDGPSAKEQREAMEARIAARAGQITFPRPAWDAMDHTGWEVISLGSVVVIVQRALG